MRILIISNAPFAPTGYGVQCKFLVQILQSLGHTVAVYVNYGLAGARLNMGGITLYPCGRSGEDAPPIVGAHVQDHRADVVINLQDMWTLSENYNEHFPSGVKWLSWFPVDHDPPAPGTVHWAHKVDVPISYTLCGRDALRGLGVTKSEYIPLVVDTDTFNHGDQGEARERLGWEDDWFIATMVAMNKGPRKAYPEQFDAFRRFASVRADLNPRLYVHADSLRQGGFDLYALAKSLGIFDRTIWANRYQLLTGFPPDYMADVYRASDVLLAATKSEGFGLPIVEAQACGCAVITTEWTAMPEVTLNGICTPVRGREWTPLSSWWGQPDVESIEAALLNIAGWDEGTKTQRDVKAQQKIVFEYSVAAVTERWRELL